MNFNQYKDIVEEGDLVIVWQGKFSQFCFKVEANQIHQTKYGSLKHNDIIGSKYGSKIKCGGSHKLKNFKSGWVYVLQPTLELWTKHLPHRTQILYPTDISIIMFELDITPGKIICESGTGSGSLSHYLLNGILPTGHLFTYDIDEERCNCARSEFLSHGYKDENFTITHQNVCELGFTLSSLTNNINPDFLNTEIKQTNSINSSDHSETIMPKAEIIILDLPTPWLAIPHAKTILSNSGGGRIVSFSPCIEQVQRTSQAMRDHNFCQLNTLECVGMVLDVKTVCMPYIEDEVNGIEEESMKRPVKKQKCPTYEFDTATKPAKVTGHTGYLTFANYFAN